MSPFQYSTSYVFPLSHQFVIFANTTSYLTITNSTNLSKMPRRTQQPQQPQQPQGRAHQTPSNMQQRPDQSSQQPPAQVNYLMGQQYLVPMIYHTQFGQYVIPQQFPYPMQPPPPQFCGPPQTQQYMPPQCSVQPAMYSNVQNINFTNASNHVNVFGNGNNVCNQSPQSVRTARMRDPTLYPPLLGKELNAREKAWVDARADEAMKEIVECEERGKNEGKEVEQKVNQTPSPSSPVAPLTLRNR